MKELWKYYCVLSSTSTLEENKLLVLVSVPLLERGRMFEVYAVINLPIPFLQIEQKHGIVAEYMVEAEFLALNCQRGVSLCCCPGKKQIGCKVDPLGTCGAANPVYLTGSNKLCVIELFRGDKGKIEENC